MCVCVCGQYCCRCIVFGSYEQSDAQHITSHLRKDAFDVDLGLNRVARLPIRRGECEELGGGVQRWFEDVTAPDACEYLGK